MKGLTEKIKFKFILITLIIATMLLPLIMPVTLAVGEEQEENTKYVQFKASWANGTTQNNVQTGTNAYIIFNLYLSGIPTGFQDLKIYAKESNPSTTQVTGPAAIINYEPTDYATSKENVLTFEPAMNSGIEIGSGINVVFKPTEDLTKYDKDIELILVGKYKDLSGKEQNINESVKLSAHVTPVKAEGFAIKTSYSNTSDSKRKEFDNFWAEQGFKEWATTEFGGDILLKVEANNTSYLEYNIVINPNDSRAMQMSNISYIIDPELEQDGFTATTTRDEGTDITRINLKKGVKNNTYSTQNIFDINKTYTIKLYSTLQENAIDKWRGGGPIGFDYRIYGEGQGYTVIKTKENVTNNNIENYNYGGYSSGIGAASGSFKYLYGLSISNGLENKTRPEINNEIASGEIEINSKITVSGFDYRLERDVSNISVAIQQDSTSQKTEDRQGVKVFYYDENGIEKFAEISDICYVKQLNDLPEGSQLKINGKPVDNIVGDISSKNISAGAYKIDIPLNERGSRRIDFGIDYTIPVDKLINKIGEDNLDRIISILTCEYTEYNQGGYPPRKYEINDKVLPILENVYLNNSGYDLDEIRDRAIYVFDTNEYVLLTEQELAYINTTVLKSEKNNSIYGHTVEELAEMDPDSITKVINGKEVKIYSLTPGFGLQYGYTEKMTQDFYVGRDKNDNLLYENFEVAHLYRNMLDEESIGTDSNAALNPYQIVYAVNENIISKSMTENMLAGLNEILQECVNNYGFNRPAGCYDLCMITGEENEDLSYLSITADDYDSETKDANKIFTKTFSIKMNKDEKVIATANKSVRNKNPKIYVELPSDFRYDIQAVTYSGGSARIGIPNIYEQQEGIDGKNYNTGWYLTKNAEGKQYLVINCIGEYYSSQDEDFTITVTHKRELINSDASAQQELKAYMITDNKNYLVTENNSMGFNKGEDIPEEVAYAKYDFSIKQSNNVTVIAGVYGIEQKTKEEIRMQPSADNGVDVLNTVSSKTNPAIYPKGETVKYYSKILNNTDKSISDVNMITRLPVAENTAITTGAELLEDDYKLTNAFWEYHKDPGQLGSLSKENAIPEISLNSIKNIKVYILSKKGRKVELDKSAYTIGYSTDSAAGVNSEYTIYEPGVTDLSGAKTLQVKLKDGQQLAANNSIILDYEMTMPQQDGMVGETMAVSYKKQGEIAPIVLEPIPVYVMTGEYGSIEVTKAFQGFDAGVVPPNLMKENGTIMTSLEGIEFKFTYEDEDGTIKPLIVDGTNAQGIATTDENGKIKLNRVPDAVYHIEEITKFKNYDTINFKNIEVRNSGSEVVEVTNPIKRTTLTINKKWEDTDEQQGFVTFRITRTDDNYNYSANLNVGKELDPETNTWVSTGVATGIEIPYGTYTIEEISAKYGWYGEDQTVTIDANNQNAVVDYENKIGKGTIVITKTVPSADTVTGLKFEISGNGYVNYKNKSGKLVNTDTFTEVTIGEDYASNENINVQIAENGKSATITLTNMPLGIYSVKEVEMPKIGEGENETDRYAVVEQTGDLNQNGGTTNISLTNQWKSGNLKIVKTAAEGVDLTQFRVRVSCEETQYGTHYDETFTFPANGELTVPNLVLGVYKVEEIESDYYNAYYSKKENGEDVKTLVPQEYRIFYDKTTIANIYNENATGFVKILKTLEGKDAEKAIGLKFNVSGYDQTGKYITEEIELTKTEVIDGTKYAVGISEAILAGNEYVVTEANTPQYYVEPDEISVDIKKINTLQNPAIINIDNKRAKGDLDISTVTIPEGGPLYPIVYRVAEIELDGTSYTEIEGTEQIINANATGAEVLKGINAGNYIVEQVSIPAGYTKDLPQIVEVPGEGTGYAIFEIEKIEELENTKVIIKKEVLNSEGEVATEQEINNAKLNANESFEVKITNVDTKDIYYTFISSANTGVIKGLPEGTYEIEEQYKPKYTTQEYSKKVGKVYVPIEPLEGKYRFTIGNEIQNENVVEIRIQNKIDTTYGFGGQTHCDNYSKVDLEEEEIVTSRKAIVYIVDEEGNALPGASFKLLDNKGKEVVIGLSNNVFVSNNRKLVIKGLPAGVYTFKCTDVPNGYIIPEDKQIIVYEDAVRVARIEIQRNIPRGSLTLGAKYTTKNGTEKYAQRSKYMIMNSETEELLTFEKKADGSYTTSNVETATDTINVRAGSMQISGIPAGIEYKVALVDVTEKFGVVNETPETVTVVSGETQEVIVPIKERTGWKTISNLGNDTSYVAIDNNGEVWGYQRNASGAMAPFEAYKTGGEFIKLTKSEGYDNIKNVRFVDGYCNDSAELTLLDSEGKIWSYAWGYDANTITKEYEMICLNDIEGHQFNGLRFNKITTGTSGNDTVKIGDIPVGIGLWGIDENGKVWNWYRDKINCVSNGTIIENLKIVDIEAGRKAIGMIDEYGNVWAIGENSNGKCAMDPTNGTMLYNLTCINTGNNLEGVKIKKIAIGWCITLFLDESNRIWTCGSKYNMGLGPNETGIQWNPICLTTLEGNPIYGVEIDDISVEDTDIGIIDTQGRLWTYGDYDSKLNALGNNESYDVPICVSDAEGSTLQGIKLKKVNMASGIRSSAIDVDGNIWIWGQKEDIPDGTRYGYGATKPTKITVPMNSYFTVRSKFTKIVNTQNSSFAIDEQGRMWGWGNTGHNKYGNSREETVESTEPVCLTNNYRYNELLQNKIVDIQATSYGVLVLDDKGQVWSWGHDGACLGYIVKGTEFYKPVCLNKLDDSPIFGKNIKSINAKYYTSMAMIDSNGKLYVSNQGENFKCINDEYTILQNVSFEKGMVIDFSSCTTTSLIALDSNNKVWVFGDTKFGQLGTGNQEEVTTPICISNDSNSPLKNVKIVDCDIANNGSTLMLDENGKVWVCGYNWNGQCGNGTTENILSPVCISDMEDSKLYGKIITKISSKSYWSVAIDSKNKMYTWGSYQGNGTGSDQHMPVCITDLYNIYVKSISDSLEVATIITDINDQLYGLGSASSIFGNLPYNLYYPTKLYGTTQYTSIYDNVNFVKTENGIITDSAGKTYEIEPNGIYGIVKNTPEEHTPEETQAFEEVEEVNNIKQIVTYSTTPQTVVIVDTNGKLWTKGYNVWGQLGDGTTINREKYVCISNIEGNPLKDITIDKIINEYTYDNKIVLLDTTGKIWYSGTSDNIQKVPTKIFEDINIEKIYNCAGSGINKKIYVIDNEGKIWYYKDKVLTCLNLENVALNTIKFKSANFENGNILLDTHGDLWVWGSNSSYNLGIENLSTISEPTKVIMENKVEEIVCNTGRATIIKNELGEYLACGYNYCGTVGVGSTESFIKVFTPITALSGINISKIVYNSGTIIVLSDDGKVYTWGQNYSGECGNGTTTNINSPTCINEIHSSILSDVVFKDIELKDTVASAKDTTGKIWKWGVNYNCQIAFSDDVIITTPQGTDKFENQEFTVSKYLIEGSTIIIESTDGKIWGWGSNGYGLLCTGDTQTVKTPINITQAYADKGCTISEIISINSQSMLVKDSNGKLWASGKNESGRFGTGTNSDLLVPTKLSDDININTAIYKYISNDKIIVVNAQGKLYTSGTSTYGGNSLVCVNDVEGTPLYGKTIAKAEAINNGATVVVITSDGKLYIITTTIKSTSGVVYEQTGTWNTGFILLKDGRYND